MSQLKSLICSLFAARFRKYDKNRFNREYFSSYESSPDIGRAQYFRDFFKPDNMLDVGCGTGNLVWGFVKLGIPAQGVDVTGIPFQNASEEVRPFLKVGDILDLDYSDDKFDLVTCCDVLEHIPFPECDKAVDELYRLTGKWLLCNICLWTEANARKDPTHINLHSRRWWRRYFDKKDFELAKIPGDYPSRKNSFIIRKKPGGGTRIRTGE